MEDKKPDSVEREISKSLMMEEKIIGVIALTIGLLVLSYFSYVFGYASALVK